MAPPLWIYLIGAALAYLVGSIPFGLVLSRLAGYGDIRNIGSGNIGATNVLRTGNKGLAGATLVLDAGKGAVAVLVGWHFGMEMASVAAVFSFLGHLFPVWLGFRGGKGVATSAGVLLAYLWPVGVATALTWLMIVIVTRYSSMAALTAAILAPILTLVVTWEAEPTLVVLALSLLVIFRHADNIRRLGAGEETKIRLRKSA